MYCASVYQLSSASRIQIWAQESIATTSVTQSIELSVQMWLHVTIAITGYTTHLDQFSNSWLQELL